MSYYKLWNDYEAIDLIRHVLTEEELRGYYKGNILKYKSRAGNKPGESAEKDLAKAREYQKWLEELDDDNNIYLEYMDKIK